MAMKKVTQVIHLREVSKMSGMNEMIPLEHTEGIHPYINGKERWKFPQWEIADRDFGLYFNRRGYHKKGLKLEPDEYWLESPTRCHPKPKCFMCQKRLNYISQGDKHNDSFVIRRHEFYNSSPERRRMVRLHHIACDSLYVEKATTYYGGMWSGVEDDDFESMGPPLLGLVSWNDLHVPFKLWVEADCPTFETEKPVDVATTYQQAKEFLENNENFQKVFKEFMTTGNFDMETLMKFMEEQNLLLGGIVKK